MRTRPPPGFANFTPPPRLKERTYTLSTEYIDSTKWTLIGKDSDSFSNGQRLVGDEPSVSHLTHPLVFPELSVNLTESAEDLI